MIGLLLVGLALAGDCAQQGDDQLKTTAAFGFEPRTATLVGSEAALAEVVCAMGADEGLTLTVAVHTDSQGSGAYNQAQSQARAEAIVGALVAGGIAAERLEARGYGEDWPIASNQTAEGRAQNRRIELWTTAPSVPAPKPAEPAVEPAPEPAAPRVDPLCGELAAAVEAGQARTWVRGGSLGEAVGSAEACLDGAWSASRDGNALYATRPGWLLAVELRDGRPVVALETQAH